MLDNPDSLNAERCSNRNKSSQPYGNIGAIAAWLLAAVNTLGCVRQNSFDDDFHFFLNNVSNDPGSWTEMACDTNPDALKKFEAEKCKNATGVETFDHDGVPCIKCRVPFNR